MVLAGRHAVERAARLTAGVEDPGPDWRLGPVVEALQALRGAALIRAVTFMAGIGDVRRFENLPEWGSFACRSIPFVHLFHLAVFHCAARSQNPTPLEIQNI
tara:strand:+ start:4522 stop:4827 length:306 start_codon:yes stop_codon:yes gene_type:complete